MGHMGHMRLICPMCPICPMKTTAQERVMVKCPMCSKPVQPREERCPTCQADLSLIAEYVKDLQTGLDLAQEHIKAGRLGEAVWTYLEVLEIDPDNAVARKQVGRVATAVRQFDNAAPSRRWMRGL